MEITYYPDMYLTSEHLLKQMLLTWRAVKTIVPPSEKAYVDAYLAGEISKEEHLPLERYKSIYDVAGEKVVDFLVIHDDERQRASEHMLDLLANWNADTRFYDSLKIRSLDDLKGKWVQWYWFLHEKIEGPLVELMLREQLVVNWAPGEVVGFQEVGKSYMSVVATELQRTRNVRLITDDGFYMAAKCPALLERSERPSTDNGYELVSLAIPQVFFDPIAVNQLSWKRIFSIRRDLLPLTESFYREIEEYQTGINKLVANNRCDEAFAKFCEFCERVASSFRPLAKEVRKILRLATPETLGLVNGILLPAAKLANGNPELAKVCDIAALASTVGRYAVSGAHQRLGFEYLENLSRALDIARMKSTITSLIPSTLRQGRVTSIASGV